MASNTGKTIVALLLGTAVGAAAGILFAPDEGRKTRRRLKRTFDEATDNVKQNLENLNDDLRNKADKLKGTLEENIETLLSRSSYKAEEAIEILEKKLEQLKKANAKLQK